MKRRAVPVLWALIALALPAGRAAAQPPAPGSERIEASRAIVARADISRLMRERAYAERMLGHLDTLEPLTSSSPAFAMAIDNYRLLALMGAERRDEAVQLLDRIVARRADTPPAYWAAWLVALGLGDTERAVRVADTASRSVPEADPEALRSLFARDSVSFMFRRLGPPGAELRIRFVEALLRIGYPGGDRGFTDDLRLTLAEERLRRGDLAGATGYAASIETPELVLPLIALTKFDAILPAGRDRLAWLDAAIAARDRETAEALRAAPTDLRIVFDRVRHLYGTGRNEEALAVARPFLADVARTAAPGPGDTGMWLINEAANVLMALGRTDESVALMRRLAGLPVEGHPGLINVRINHSALLWQAGRFRDALDHATRINRAHADIASDYGEMWLASTIVCSLARLDRAGEAGPQMERLRANRDVNPAALTRAHLCLAEDDAAAALLVRRLEGADPQSLVLALQDYALPPGDGADEDALGRRFLALRERPEVRAALERVGRVLRLPLAQTYWGAF